MPYFWLFPLPDLDLRKVIIYYLKIDQTLSQISIMKERTFSLKQVDSYQTLSAFVFIPTFGDFHLHLANLFNFSFPKKKRTCNALKKVHAYDQIVL